MTLAVSYCEVGRARDHAAILQVVCLRVVTGKQAPAEISTHTEDICSEHEEIQQKSTDTFNSLSLAIAPSLLQSETTLPLKNQALI